MCCHIAVAIGNGTSDERTGLGDGRSVASMAGQYRS